MLRRFGRELTLRFEPNFFVLADGTIASVPNFSSTSGNGIMGESKWTGGIRTHGGELDSFQGTRRRNSRSLVFTEQRTTTRPTDDGCWENR